MGQGVSCIEPHDHALFAAVQNGELGTVQALIGDDPKALQLRTVHRKLSALHLAAADGRIEILSMLLNRSVNPDVLNRHKQTPLMLAAMHGKTSCVKRLIQAGANVLMFDSLNGRTCLHYAAYYGNSECLKVILSAAHSSHVAESWGFARFVNIRDGSGSTPLHLAARQGQSECVHILLTEGALVCASTGGFGYTGSMPLHLAARGGSLDCVRELLAWGADRLQRDSVGRIPYMVALKHKHGGCAALLNPSSPAPLTWPSPLKFINELNSEAKALLENALIEANKVREKSILKDTIYSFPSPLNSDSGDLDNDDSQVSDIDLCCICFEQTCTIEVQNCGHQMCAHCTLALCCHSKPCSSAAGPNSPICPFCRTPITKLTLANLKTDVELSPSKPRRSRKSFNQSEGSCSFKGLSAMSSFKIDCHDLINKPLEISN